MTLSVGGKGKMNKTCNCPTSWFCDYRTIGTLCYGCSYQDDCSYQLPSSNSSEKPETIKKLDKIIALLKESK